MKARVPPRLGRLLGEYEKLTRDEAAALRTQDFSALDRIHSFKPALLVEIMAEGTALGLDRRVLWFDEWLTMLGGLERENVEFAARVLRQLTAQRETLESARKRLRGLGHAYTRTDVDSSRLFARS